MEKYLVISDISDTDELEYMITILVDDKGETFYLQDHRTGEVRLSITDDGNGLILSKSLKKGLDYSQQYELMLMLDFINRKQVTHIKYRFVKDVAL